MASPVHLALSSGSGLGELGRAAELAERRWRTVHR